MTEYMGLIIIGICFFTIIANLFILWIMVKLYTEIFKQQKVERTLNFARDGK